MLIALEKVTAARLMNGKFGRRALDSFTLIQAQSPRGAKSRMERFFPKVGNLSRRGAKVGVHFQLFPVFSGHTN